MLDALCCQTKMGFYLFVLIASVISCVYCAPVSTTKLVDYKLVCKSSYEEITTADCQRCPVDGCEAELLKDGCWKDVDHWYKTCFGDLGPCVSSRWYKNNDGTYGNMECHTRCPKVHETCSHVPIVPTTAPIIPIPKPEPAKTAPTNLGTIFGPLVGSLIFIAFIIIIPFLVYRARRRKQKEDSKKNRRNSQLVDEQPQSIQDETESNSDGSSSAADLPDQDQSLPDQEPRSQTADELTVNLSDAGEDNETLIGDTTENSPLLGGPLPFLNPGPGSSNVPDAEVIMQNPTAAGISSGSSRRPEENPITREEENNPPSEHSADGDDFGATGSTNSGEDFTEERDKWEAGRETEASGVREGAGSDLKVEMVCEQDGCVKAATYHIDNDGNISHNARAATGGAAAGSTTPNQSDILDGTRRKRVRARGGLENRPMSGDPSSGNETVEVTNGMKEKISLQNQPANSSTNGNHPDSHQKGAYSAPSTSTSGSSTRASSNTSTPASSNTSTPNLNRDGSLTRTNNGLKIGGSAKPESKATTTVDDDDEEDYDR